MYGLFPQHRPVMWRASMIMLPFELTEPIFVPEYWNPPSLFELTQKLASTLKALFLALPLVALQQFFTTLLCINV